MDAGVALPRVPDHADSSMVRTIGPRGSATGTVRLDEQQMAQQAARRGHRRWKPPPSDSVRRPGMGTGPAALGSHMGGGRRTTGSYWAAMTFAAIDPNITPTALRRNPRNLRKPYEEINISMLTPLRATIILWSFPQGRRNRHQRRNIVQTPVPQRGFQLKRAIQSLKPARWRRYRDRLPGHPGYRRLHGQRTIAQAQQVGNGPDSQGRS